MSTEFVGYFYRRGTRRERHIIESLHERERLIGPSMAASMRRPVLVGLAGHDPMRITEAKKNACGAEYDWWTP